MRLYFLIAIGAALILPAAAATDQTKPRPKRATQKVSKTAATQKQKSTPATAGRVVSVDPETGELRSAAPGTVPAASAARSVAPPTISRKKDGSFSAAVPEAKQVFSVAEVKPDGSMSQSHTTATELKKRGRLTGTKEAAKPEGARP